jgi:hypothetical protein
LRKLTAQTRSLPESFERKIQCNKGLRLGLEPGVKTIMVPVYLRHGLPTLPSLVFSVGERFPRRACLETSW